MPAAWMSPSALPQPAPTGPRTRRDLLVDAAGCLAAAALGVLFVTPDLRDSGSPLSTAQLVVDISCGALACLSLWWRRRWPLGVALACAALGMVSTSATPAGLLALSSLAVYRPLRPVLLVALLWIPCVLVFAVLQSDDWPPLRVPARDATRARGHRLGDVPTGSTTTSSDAARKGHACGERSTSARGAGQDGRADPDRA